MPHPTVEVTVRIYDIEGNPCPDGTVVTAKLDKNDMYEGFVVAGDTEGVTAGGSVVLSVFPNNPTTGLGTTGSVYTFKAQPAGLKSLRVTAQIPNQNCYLDTVADLESSPDQSAADLANDAVQAAMITTLALSTHQGPDAPTDLSNPGREWVDMDDGTRYTLVWDGTAYHWVEAASFYYVADQAALASPLGASYIGYSVPGGPARTVEAKLREIKSRADLGFASPNPRLGIGVDPTATNVLVVRASTDVDTGIGSMTQLQHLIEVDESNTLPNPKALRAYTRVGSPTNALATANIFFNPWAVSGELDNYSNSPNTGATATSGVANKYGLGGVWAGHFQAKEWTDNSGTPTNVTALLGIEANMVVLGLDHPTANSALGNRFLLDVIAKSNRAAAGWAAGKEGEVGVGVLIRTEEDPNGGFFRYGMAIWEHPSNPKVIGTAMLIKTTGDYGIRSTGAHTIADLSLEANSAIGAMFSGTYGTAAIRIPAGQRIGLENTNAIKFGWDTGTTSVQFLNAGNNRVALDLSATPCLRIGGAKLVGPRVAGWAVDTGTAKRTANATYSGTAEVSYTQATIQTLMNAVRDCTQTVKALKDDFHATAGHGLIGT